MRPLRNGQDIVLSWRDGAVECRVVAAAGHYVLLRPERRFDTHSEPTGSASLVYLDGMVPMGWDGEVRAGAQPGELTFRVTDQQRSADRRSSVRVPLFAAVRVDAGGPEAHAGQLLDVSAGGMRFRHSLDLQRGQVLRVMVALPEGIVIDADAVVRAAEVGVAAVEFTAMHAADRETVGRWTVAVMRASLAAAAQG